MNLKGTGDETKEGTGDEAKNCPEITDSQAGVLLNMLVNPPGSDEYSGKGTKTRSGKRMKTGKRLGGKGEKREAFKRNTRIRSLM